MPEKEKLATDRPFEAPWQAQIFAITVALNEAGAFEWRDWVTVFSAELKAGGDGASGNQGYWRTWLFVFERFLAERGVASVDQMGALAQAWQEAARETPHGAPIELKK